MYTPANWIKRLDTATSHALSTQWNLVILLQHLRSPDVTPHRHARHPADAAISAKFSQGCIKIS